MKKLLVSSLLCAIVSLALAALASADTSVTGHVYVRHDGGTDPVIQACNNPATDPSAGSRRQQNEPSVAIKPDEPNFMVASSNDYCIVPITGDSWQGIYVSKDGGTSWTDSLLPGYPLDTSAEGQQSPLSPASGDPILDWDLHNHLFAGGISFNRIFPINAHTHTIKTNGHVYVATYERDPSAPLGINYLRTVIVGPGTPGAWPAAGRFNDKPHMKVDDWASSRCEGNVYVSWTLYPGSGLNQIRFSRSTDAGRSFSQSIKISHGIAAAQGSNIAVAPDGTVYVFWRQFAFNPTIGNAIVFVKSTDCGRTFSNPRTVSALVPSDRRDLYVFDGTARDCGDGLFLCFSNFVFHRISSYPFATIGPNGTIYLTWSQITNPLASNGDTYRPDGQSQVVATRSTNGGASWSTPIPVDTAGPGHEFWPYITADKMTGQVSLLYMDSEEDPSYSPLRPPGNEADATSPCQDANGVGTQPCDVLNAYIATSTNGLAWASTKVSTVGHQPNFEMFGGRQDAFHGDYIWVDSEMGTTFGVWTDNRDVVPGADPREAVQDGFDVKQCRTAPTAPDTCPNAGGLDQNIYGGTP